METSNFLKLVAEELDNIRAKATESELSKFNVSRFHPTKESDRCIYGQLTGSYTSSRASEITKKTFDEINSYFGEEKFKKGTSFTPLEKYMSYYRNEDRQNRIGSDEVLEVMEYLQGKRSSLTLSIGGETYNVSRFGSSTAKKGFSVDIVKEIEI